MVESLFDAAAVVTGTPVTNVAAAFLTPAPNVPEISSADGPRPEPDSAMKPPPAMDNSNRPGEPEWVTHSGVEGRPYLTEEIYESPHKVELFDADRCEPCIELNRACWTILKFPNEIVQGDIDVCGYCAKDGKKICGAGKKAHRMRLKQSVEQSTGVSVSQSRGRRVLPPKLVSPEIASVDKFTAAPGARRGMRRSLSDDDSDTEASAPKRRKIAIRRKSVPTPRTAPSKKAKEFPKTLPNGEPYDGRKDPAKVAERVAKMKMTLQAKYADKRAAKEAEANASASDKTPKTKGKPGRKSVSKAGEDEVTDAPADPTPITKAPVTKLTLKKPRTINTPIQHRGGLNAPKDDFVAKDYKSSFQTKPEKRTRRSADKQITTRKHVTYAEPDHTSSDVENGVNALLGSIEQPNGMLDDDDDDENAFSDSYFESLAAENEQLKKSLAKLERAEKRDALKEENEAMKKRIEELRRKSLTRRESSAAHPN